MQHVQNTKLKLIQDTKQNLSQNWQRLNYVQTSQKPSLIAN